MYIFYFIRLQLSYTSVNHLSFLPFKKNLGKMADSLKLHVFMYLISIIKNTLPNHKDFSFAVFFAVNIQNLLLLYVFKIT